MRWIKVTPRSHCREGGGGSREEKVIGWAALLHWEYKQKNSEGQRGKILGGLFKARLSKPGDGVKM